jgi:hypothetical protein
MKRAHSTSGLGIKLALCLLHYEVVGGVSVTGCAAPKQRLWLNDDGN